MNDFEMIKQLLIF